MQKDVNHWVVSWTQGEEIITQASTQLMRFSIRLSPSSNAWNSYIKKEFTTEI